MCPHLLPMPNHLPQSSTDSSGPPAFFWECMISTRCLLLHLITMLDCTFPSISLWLCSAESNTDLGMWAQSVADKRAVMTTAALQRLRECEYTTKTFCLVKFHITWSRTLAELTLTLTTEARVLCVESHIVSACLSWHLQYQQLTIYTKSNNSVCSGPEQTETDPMSRG